MNLFFHLNSDDIESSVFVSRISVEFRNNFNKNTFIDLVCYRKHGHNESDKSSITQLIMYKKISNIISNIFKRINRRKNN